MIRYVHTHSVTNIHTQHTLTGRTIIYIHIQNTHTHTNTNTYIHTHYHLHPALRTTLIRHIALTTVFSLDCCSARWCLSDLICISMINPTSPIHPPPAAMQDVTLPVHDIDTERQHVEEKTSNGEHDHYRGDHIRTYTLSYGETVTADRAVAAEAESDLATARQLEEIHEIEQDERADRGRDDPSHAQLYTLPYGYQWDHPDDFQQYGAVRIRHQLQTGVQLYDLSDTDYDDIQDLVNRHNRVVQSNVKHTLCSRIRDHDGNAVTSQDVDVDEYSEDDEVGASAPNYADVQLEEVLEELVMIRQRIGEAKRVIRVVSPAETEPDGEKAIEEVQEEEEEETMVTAEVAGNEREEDKVEKEEEKEEKSAYTAYSNFGGQVRWFEQRIDARIVQDLDRAVLRESGHIWTVDGQDGGCSAMHGTLPAADWPSECKLPYAMAERDEWQTKLDRLEEQAEAVEDMDEAEETARAQTSDDCIAFILSLLDEQPASPQRDLDEQEDSEEAACVEAGDVTTSATSIAVDQSTSFPSGKRRRDEPSDDELDDDDQLHRYHNSLRSLIAQIQSCNNLTDRRAGGEPREVLVARLTQLHDSFWATAEMFVRRFHPRSLAAWMAHNEIRLAWLEQNRTDLVIDRDACAALVREVVESMSHFIVTDQAHAALQYGVEAYLIGIFDRAREMSQATYNQPDGALSLLQFQLAVRQESWVRNGHSWSGC